MSLYETANTAISNKVQEEIDAHQQIQFHTVSSNLYKDDGASSHVFFLLWFDNASSHVWSTPESPPTQVVAVNTLLFNQKCKDKPLVIDQTGLGESHILHMTAVMIEGIILHIIPLLALTVDEVAKIEEAL